MEDSGSKAPLKPPVSFGLKNANESIPSLQESIAILSPVVIIVQFVTPRVG